MIRLGEVARGHDNNLNLVRLCAAVAVLVSHAWPISRGGSEAEPLTKALGHSMGTIAVYVFFAISGFLITASFLRSRTLGEFALARFARLYPGLIVSLLLVAFVLGPLTTELPIDAYLTAARTWSFLLSNTILAWPQYTLPGVFEANPFPSVEGSIWTLIHEIICYLMVVVAGLSGLLLTGRRMALFLALYGAAWVLTLIAPELFPPRVLSLRNLSLPFVLGMAGWIWRDRVPLSLWLVVALGLLWFGLRETPVAFPVFIALIAYGTAWLAYVPGGFPRHYNRLGDYSYGVYIYAFPLQGLVVWLFGPTDPVAHIALALPPVLLISVLSWHLVEKPALDRLKRWRDDRRRGEKHPAPLGKTSVGE